MLPTQTESNRPLWMFGLPADDPAGAAKELAQHGYSAVVLGASSDQAIIARDAGLTTFACLRTFPVDPASDGEDLLAESALGGRLVWFESGCPNAPELRARHLERVRELVSSPRWDGVFLDGIRFASPNAGNDAFFTCFCARCRLVAERLGYDFERMRRDVGVVQSGATGRAQRGVRAIAAADALRLLLRVPGSVYYAGMFDWLRFRAECVAEHVAAVRRVVSETTGKLLGAYLFSPSLAPLVGQDYRRLAPYLDVVSPMIYRRGAGDAVLASELESLATFLIAAGVPEPEAIALVTRNTSVMLGDTDPSVSDLEAHISPSTVGVEVQRAANEIGGFKKLMPIVWLDDPLLKEVMVECGDGAGLCLFLMTDATRTHGTDAAAYWLGLAR